MDLQKIAADASISVDEVRERWLTLRVALWKADFRRFCKEALKIRSKDGDLVSLVLNSAQELVLHAAEKQLQDDRWVRLLALKGRRQGFSTLVAARGLWRSSLWQRQRVYLLSHEMMSSNVLFDIVSLMVKYHPFPPETGTQNAKELEFQKLGSTYQVATAGQKAGGRGGAVSFFHGSEAAWWVSAEEHFASSVQAVDEVRGVWGVLWREPVNPLPFEKGIGEVEGWVKAPSEIYIETTSSGPSGVFHERFMEALKGQGRYRAVFAPWILQPEYVEFGEFIADNEPDEEGDLSEAEYQQTYKLTDAQMLWRRSKKSELGSPGKFKQEYPIDVVEAFSAVDIEDVFIKPMHVLRARKRVMDDPDAPLIIGVDPAGGGGDRFAVAFRRGDKCLKVSYRNKLDQNAAVAWLSSIIERDKPNRMNIDRGNMGAEIITALRNIDRKYADIVRGVDFGGKSKAKTVHPDRAGPVNKRAEIYKEMRDWLLQGGCIPDDDDLASDMSGPKTKWRPNNDYLLESKTDMKARGLRSSDLSDALALTFASKEWFEEWSKPKREVGWQQGSTPEMQRIDAPGIGDSDGYYVFGGNTSTSWMG